MRRIGWVNSLRAMPYQPTPWMMLPFAGLLVMIALGPLLFPAWWLRHYPKVAFGLGIITVAYYYMGLPASARLRVLTIAHDYISFIAVIGSLYVVSGGIHMTVKGEATPFENARFLFVGALLANVLGTTGASMLLIRPWLRMNKYRVTGHHVVFFIFIMSNVGGCLTPVGDPPLFLGYLKGIPFWWVAEHCWPMWAVAMAYLLAVFFVIDRRNYLRGPTGVRARLAEPPERWRFQGVQNLGFLAVILGSVFISDPPFLREGVMVAAAFASYFGTADSVHEANHFDFQPVKEVAILFAGIFATMMPALDWLQENAGKIGQPTETLFFWSSGLLSSVLDNAPTYLSFLSAIFGAFVNQETVTQVQHLIANGGIDIAQAAEPVRHTYEALQKYHAVHLANKSVDVDHIRVAYLLGNAGLNGLIVAISIASVFCGANTYIGNGPNFMVKSIADKQKVHTPGFIGFVLGFTLPVMLPMLVLVWWLFFRQ